VTQMNSRGFTLIEIMVSLALTGIISTVIFGTAVVQQRSFETQLTFTEAHQNARAAIDVIRSQLRNAGWGFAAGANLVGRVSVGACPNASDILTDVFSCDGGNANSDLIRIYSATPLDMHQM